MNLLVLNQEIGFLRIIKGDDMKNKAMLLVVSLFFFSTIVPQAPEKNPALWEKIKTYAQNNKGKIFAVGLAVIAAALGTVAVGYINDKADRAIRKADIKEGSLDYKQAKFLITTYGILGLEEGIENLVKYEKANELFDLGTSKVGQALANFWGISQANLASRLAAKGIGSVVREGVAAVKETAQEGAQAVKEGWRKFKKLW